MPPPQPDDPAEPSACPNCGEGFGDPRPAFCPACGQETALRPPRLGEFVQQFGGAFVSTEGALWRTLKLLLLRPGELTRQYLAGRRKSYVLPLRLYLTSSVIVLLLLRLAAAPDALQVHVAEPASGPQTFEVDLGLGRAGLAQGRFYCERLPQWVCSRLQHRLDLDRRQVELESQRFAERFMGHLGGAMFVLLPGFALLMKLAYLNRGLRLSEHLVFALHLHAFWFLALTLSLPGLPVLKAAATLAIPLYAVLAMRRVYGGRWGPLLLRAGAVAVVYLGLLVLTLAGLVVVAYFA